MTISAKIILDSISSEGIRLTTFQLRYPKFIHGELMTHRVFSRNASSSRAIPVKRVIQDLWNDPAIPVSWGKNQKGMQADENFDEIESQILEEIWLDAMEAAIERAELFIARGVCKQIANRVMEPFFHINTLVTATRYQNFFNLRCHPFAQPEIQELANQMKKLYDNCEPVYSKEGSWHLPYITEEDLSQTGLSVGSTKTSIMKKVSVARCARVSYLTQEGKKPSIEDDLKLYKRLMSAEPPHASPAEHQAMPDTTRHRPADLPPVWDHPHEHGNLYGWRQLRRMLPGGIADE